MDVFVRDRVAGQTILVSVTPSGKAGNASSFAASISADGRYVAFLSDASNLIPGDTNHVRDVFVRDLVAGTTERVTVASDGTPQNSDAAYPSISADGSRVAFASFATNLVPDDDNGMFDVFVRDRTAGTTVIVSVATDGTQGDQPSITPAISGNGRYVAFASDATTLIGNDGNERRDVFLRDLSKNKTIRVSVTNTGAQADGQSVGPGVRGGLVWGPAINFNGTRIAFDSVATNLVADDTNTCQPSFPGAGQCPDVFVRDVKAKTTVRVSVASDGSQGNDAEHGPVDGPGGHVGGLLLGARTWSPRWRSSRVWLIGERPGLLGRQGLGEQLDEVEHLDAARPRAPRRTRRAPPARGPPRGCRRRAACRCCAG